jgi:hypothetical protein
LEDGTTYIQVAAGDDHTVLLRSDGSAVACGHHGSGRCQIPPLGPGDLYVADMSWGERGSRVVQLDFASEDDTLLLICSDLAGKEVLRLNAAGSDLCCETHKRIAREMKINLQRVRIVLPDGQLLASFCRKNPEVTMADAAKHCERFRSCILAE